MSGRSSEAGGEAMLLPAVLDPWDERWLRFVRSWPEAGVQHHPAWLALLHDVTGAHGFVLVMLDGRGEVRCGMPVQDVRDVRGRRRWVVLPYTPHCMPLGPPDVLDLFAAEVSQLLRRAHVSRLEVHASTRAPAADVDTHRASVPRSLRRPPASPWAYATSRSSRTLRVAVHTLDAGSPVTPQERRMVARCWPGASPLAARRYARAVWRRIVEPGLGFVVVVGKSERPVAVAVCTTLHGHVVLQHAAARHGAHHRAAAALLTSACLGEAEVRGYATADVSALPNSWRPAPSRSAARRRRGRHAGVEGPDGQRPGAAADPAARWAHLAPVEENLPRGPTATR